MPTLEVGLLVLGFGVRGCRVWGILGLGPSLELGALTWFQVRLGCVWGRVDGLSK